MMQETVFGRSSTSTLGDAPSVCTPRSGSNLENQKVDELCLMLANENMPLNGIVTIDQSKESCKEDNGFDEVDIALVRPKLKKPGIVSKPSDDKGIDETDKTTVIPTEHDSNGSKSGQYDTRQILLSWKDLLNIIFGLVTFLLDVGSDIWMVIIYFQDSDWWYFSLTLTCVLVSSFVMTLFSLFWYIQDWKDNKDSAGSNDKTEDQTITWIPRAIFLFLQLAPVIRYFESIVYFCRGHRAKSGVEKHRWYDCMVKENADSCLLRLMECFLESAPQLILQLFIIQNDGLKPAWYQTTLQVTTCITSLVSLSWAVASYQKALRKTNSVDITCLSMPVIVLWRLFTIGARVLALALLVFLIKQWVVLAVGLHWLVMFIWITRQDSPFCEQKWQKPLFNVVMALIYVFAYLNLQEGHTRLRYLVYYSIMYAENLAIVISWCIIRGQNMDEFHLVAVVFIAVGFFIGIIFQSLYYLKFHPRNNSPEGVNEAIHCCVPWSEVYLTKPLEKPKSEEEAHNMMPIPCEDMA